MTWPEAYLEQARSDWRMFEFLAEAEEASAHDYLHSLQMCVEKLCKAILLRSGNPLAEIVKTHRVVGKALRHLKASRNLRERLGKSNAAWTAYFASLTPAADTLERLTPALSGDGPNVEYPWATPDGTVSTPCMHTEWAFDRTQDIGARQLLSLIDILLEEFEAFFG